MLILARCAAIAKLVIFGYAALMKVWAAARSRMIDG
jgi:hypothetical protein